MMITTPPVTPGSLSAEDVAVGARLDGVTLTLAPGTLTFVVGENGSGKTTLLDALAGTAPLSRGRVLLDGVDVRALRPRARAQSIASLAQENIDLDDVTAAERIGHGLAPRRGSDALLDDAALALISAVAAELGVDGLLDRDLGALSAGERRRVEVARALVDDQARAILVDEPHGGVDVRHQALVSRALIARAKGGALVVASVHDLGVAAAHGDRLLGLRAGRIVVDAPAAGAITSAAIEQLYGVSGAVVVREGGAVGVLLPR